MIQTEYRRELNHSYMIIKNTETCMTQQYAYRMIRENRIRRLLTCQERIVDGESCLYYEISSRQTLEQFYEGKRLNAAQIGQILRAIVQVQQDMGEYLLDGESLLLDPVSMFADVETEELFFCFYPGWGKNMNSYAQLADFFLEHVDHGQESAVNLAYQFYKISKAGNFVLSSFMPFVEKECTEVRKAAPVIEETMWKTTPDLQPFFSPVRENDDIVIDLAELEQDETGRDIKKKENKQPWYRRLLEFLSFGDRRRNAGQKQYAKGKTGSPDSEYSQSLWDVYADKLESREAGETIYFSDLEKVPPRPVGNPFLVEVGGERRFSLENLPVTVGKLSAKAGIVLDDPSVSRVHARFFSEGSDELWLIDLNSRNLTTVNDKRLSPNEAVKVEAGDEIRFGRERFQIAFIDSQKD